MIDDQQLRDLLKCALKENHEERFNLQQLSEHPFFSPENTKNDGFEVKLNGTFDLIIKEEKEAKEKLLMDKQQQQKSSSFSSLLSNQHHKLRQNEIQNAF